ncbi:MAG: TetR/AcrR family transcriptional regulator [Candidatus Acidiferrales bacterium]|jgi:AcrR family transcriptional regulator
MAVLSKPRLAPLHREDWIKAAFARLSDLGVEAVRVEVLARDLGVSKGSFYWHFRNRIDLLDRMLASWEDEELHSIDPDEDSSAATRWARFVQGTADPNRIRVEVAVRAWARRDERVARAVAIVERRRSAVIANVLRDVGFARPAAELWSQVALLVCLGWLDRATRDREFQLASRSLGEFLSELVLAASSRPPTSSPWTSSKYSK